MFSDLYYPLPTRRWLYFFSGFPAHTFCVSFTCQRDILELEKKKKVCLAVFLNSGVPPAHSSRDPCCVTVACPAALLPLTVGPTWPAWPVTLLVDSRSCSYNELEIVRLRYTLKTVTVKSRDIDYVSLRWFLLPGTLALSPLKFWHPRPSNRLAHMHMHFPSRRARVPPLWHGLHLHTLYSAT